ncbi:aldo/keto reductase [Streptococcus sp. H49]|uniref:aldo/keto reductase n=1 Tax=Streptococcus huangxiaojuni TaxID=3237239 RepID=UPI0034A2C82B
MQYVTLNTGALMPQLGFGVYQIPEKETAAIVSQAIKTGYRHIDTAQYYRNEVGVGQAVKASGLPREDFFITTKLATSGYGATKTQISRALKKLQTDYIDLMLIHWVVSDYLGTYRALQEAYEAGQLKAIGLSNFNQKQIKEILARFSVRPAVLQNEMHVFRQQAAMRQFCHDNGIQFESWAPFGEGKENIFAHPLLTAIGNSYGKTAAQVILRFLLQEAVVAIPKSADSGRMRQNFEIFDFELSSEDMESIRQLDRGRSLFGWNG